MRLIHFEKVSIPLSSIREGISTFTIRIVSHDLQVGKGRRFPSDIVVRAKVTTVGGDYFVELLVESEGHFVCDRCGEEFKKEIAGELHLLFTFDSMKIQDEENDAIKLLSSNTSEIDITQDVTDTLLLAVPSKVLCYDTCRGLCPQCGVNWNKDQCSCSQDQIDSRWEALKDLQSDD